MGDFSDFQRGQIVGARLAGASVTKMATLFGVYRAAVSKVVMTYTNHGRTSSAKRNSGRKPAELNIHLEDHFHKKESDENFTNPSSMVELQLLNLLLLKTVLSGEKDGVMITKPGHLMSGNTYCGQVSHPLLCSQHQARFMFGHHPRKPECMVPTVKCRARSVMFWAALSSILLVLYKL
jgi:hypothetical protein